MNYMKIIVFFKDQRICLVNPPLSRGLLRKQILIIFLQVIQPNYISTYHLKNILLHRRNISTSFFRQLTNPIKISQYFNL